ncbi:MAG: tRNA modification GTPase [Myxococcota bacterium]|jgi:tRNA modification GTPase
MGRSGVAMLRLSGPEAKTIASAVCPGGPPWRPRRVSLRTAIGPDGPIDALLVVWMPGPRSFTGEDVVELSCHGNPVIIELLLSVLIEAGARMARPGEFTRQALLSGRTTLLGAEALRSLIAATSPAGVALAHAGMGGATDALSASLSEALLDLAAELEARLDHPGDELGYDDDLAVIAGLHGVAERAGAAAMSWRAGRVRIQGATVALIGSVNAGKSSLFNRLVGTGRALVSPTPGTTRDVVERSVLLDGLEVRYLDTAGERGETNDPIEAAGIALGRTMTAEADLLLLLTPLSEAPSPAWPELLDRTAAFPRLRIGTHADLPAHASAPPVDLSVSSTTGDGVAVLKAAIRARLSAGTTGGEQLVVLSQRQHDLFRTVAEHARQAAEALASILGPAIAAEEVTAALERLAELSGEDVREAVLDRLFARFCIGK